MSTILLIIAVIALVLPVWLLSRANRNRRGQFTRNPWWEWVVLLLGVGIVVMCGFAVAGCAKPPSRTVTGGTASALSESAQTAVPPSYPPAYPQEQIAVTAPAATPADQLVSNPDELPAGDAFRLPAGWTFTRTKFHPPIPVEPPTILNRTTNSTSTTQPSSTTDIVVPKNWGGYWIGLCMLIAAGFAIVATFAPAKKTPLYVVAGIAAGLASLALVPPAHLGLALMLVVVVLLCGMAFYAYRSGLWERATTQVVKGVENVKTEIGDAGEVNRILAVEQDEVTKKLVRKARGK